MWGDDHILQSQSWGRLPFFSFIEVNIMSTNNNELFSEQSSIDYGKMVVAPKMVCDCCNNTNAYELSLGEICSHCEWEDDMLDEGYSMANSSMMSEYKRKYREDLQSNRYNHCKGWTLNTFSEHSMLNCYIAEIDAKLALL
jgi:hypothetical protein